MTEKSSIGTDRQIPELLTALKGRGEIPLKFEYLDEGASYWKDLVNSIEYGLGRIELDLILESVPSIARLIKKNRVSIIDVGCGSGEKGVAVTMELVVRGIEVNYAGLDISETMLEEAVHQVKTVDKINNVEFHKVDFEEGNFAYITSTMRKVHDCDNILLLLGHTLGNPADKNRLLTNLRESMTVDDYIIIGVELVEHQQTNSIVHHYQNEKLYTVIFNVLSKLGVQRSDGHFDIQFNITRGQVEMKFIFDKLVSIEYGGETIRFETGDKVLLGVSYKFTKRGLHNLLENTGFRIKSFMLNNSEDYALVICQIKIIR